MKDKSGEAKALNNIGNVYKSLKKFDKALDCYKQAVLLHESVGHKGGVG
jgi:tetratricopeptide (TPR) repeat protein